MVSIGVSLLGCTELFFVEPGVKVNGSYFHSSCYQQSDSSRETTTCSNRTVRLHIERSTPWKC
jgi:hypothetical protein